MASANLVPFSGGRQAPVPQLPRNEQRLRRKQEKQAARKASKPLFRGAATGFLAAKSISLVSRQAFNEDGSLTPSAETWLTRAVTVQRPLVLANLRRLRKAHPTLTNRQLAMQLDKEFKRSMTGGGALIGATSAVPRVGTVTSMGLSVLATGSFLELCALYAQSMAELSGISTEDPQRAKLLVMGIMLGDEGRRLLGELSAQADGRGPGPVGSIVPMSSLAVNSAGSSTMANLITNQLKKQFVRRFFIRQGTSMFARAVPYGIGAVIGGVGNRALAKQITSTAHSTFGELPEQTPRALVEDFQRGLEREKLRADRKERRVKKKQLRTASKSSRKDAKAIRKAQKVQEVSVLPGEFTKN
ncbi:hypothetical protein [Nesterenkonia alkaliphila]|uniref:Di-and tripeptidase n=1 Tax=Nesterenkonia alkaliphila TaxID=1463631 RepID=A0A7K1UJ07_9MICC|nr:hypothetical protein [Nesterenkonia alkaliphila]MVT26352.1 hypothetical protein [Nesterenkonia alkaliphila]